MTLDQTLVLLLTTFLSVNAFYVLYYVTSAYRFPRHHFVARILCTIVVLFIVHLYYVINVDVFKLLFGGV